MGSLHLLRTRIGAMNQVRKARDRSPVAAAPMKVGYVDCPDTTWHSGGAAAGDRPRSGNTLRWDAKARFTESRHPAPARPAGLQSEPFVGRPTFA